MFDTVEKTEPPSSIAFAGISKSFPTALFSIEGTTVLKVPKPSFVVYANICLIAPALSGDSFKNYYTRTTKFDFKSKDNYKLTILYNDHDFVLRKKVGWFGPGPYKYVNTTLGCNTKGCTLDFQKHHYHNTGSQPPFPLRYNALGLLVQFELRKRPFLNF